MKLLCWFGWHQWWKPRFVNVRVCRRCSRTERAADVIFEEDDDSATRWELVAPAARPEEGP